MTPDDVRALDAFRGFRFRIGRAPSLTEFGDLIGVKKTSAHRRVSRLVEAGALIRKPYAKCGLDLADAPDLRHVDTSHLLAELARRGETPDALSRPERVALAGAGERSCSVDWCGIAVGRGHPFCLDHWRAISPEMQRELLTAHRLYNERGLSRAERDARGRRFQAAFAQAKEEAERLGRVE